MKLSSIRSFITYHKRLGELIDFGCLIYSPSFDPILASQIELLPIIATASYGDKVDRHIAESPFNNEFEKEEKRKKETIHKVRD